MVEDTFQPCPLTRPILYYKLNKNMNIYLIERADSNFGYDEYYGFVIGAKDKRQARKMIKQADEREKAKWKITKIGITHYKKPRVFQSDFNAG